MSKPQASVQVTCYFHCDTTGPWYFEFGPNHPDQPALVRMSMLLHSSDTGATKTASWVVRPPDDVKFDFGHMRGHNITRDVARRTGRPLEEVMVRVERILGMMTTSENVTPLFCAYSRAWHVRVLHSSARRANMDERSAIRSLDEKMVRCLMYAATPVVALPRSRGAGFKTPSMKEAYRHFTGTPLELSSEDPVAAGLTIAEALRTIDVGITAAST